MVREIFSSFSPRAQVLFLVLLVATGFLIFMGLGLLTCYLIYGNAALSAMHQPDTTSPQGINILRVMQMFYTTGIFIFPSLVLASLVSRNPMGYLDFNRPTLRFSLTSLALMVVAIPGINLISSLNAMIPMGDWIREYEEKAQQLTYAFLITTSTSTLILNFFMVAILPSVGEELLFRGVLQKLLCRLTKNYHLGILITSIIFSAFHLQFHGFIPRMLLGMLFGYMLVWSGSIWIPILAHLVNNGLAVIAFFLISRKLIPPQVEIIGEYSYYGLLGILSLGVVLWLTTRLWKERRV